MAYDVDLGNTDPAPAARTSLMKALIANKTGAIYLNDPGGK